MPKFTATKLTPEEAAAVWQAQSRLDPNFETDYLAMVNDWQVGEAWDINMKAEGVEWMSSEQQREIIYNLNEAAKRRTKKVTLTLDSLTDEERASLPELAKAKQPFVKTYTDDDEVETTREYTQVGKNWVAIVPDPVVLRYKKTSREATGEVTENGVTKQVKTTQYSNLNVRLVSPVEIRHRNRGNGATEAPAPTTDEHTNGNAKPEDVPAPFETAGAPAA